MLTRPFLIHRCTVQRRAAGTEDPYGNPTVEPFANHLTNQPCLWWADVGRGTGGEQYATERDTIIDRSRMLMPNGADITEADQIIDIRDRRGNVITAGPWNIVLVTYRPSQGGKLLMLERP